MSVPSRPLAPQAESILPGQANDNVLYLVDQLKALGWQQVPFTSWSQWQEGAIVYGNNDGPTGAGGDQHIGVLDRVHGQKGESDNNSDDGEWHFSDEAGSWFSPLPGGHFVNANGTTNMWLLLPPSH